MDDRRHETRELGPSQELLDLISALPRHQQQLNRVFWRDISAYAIDNGHRLQRMQRQLRRFMAVVSMWLAVISAVVILTGVKTLGESTRIQQSIQTSRYDSTYRACVNTNTRHDNADGIAGALSRLNPTAGVLAVQLIDVLAPLRDGMNGRMSCAQYAEQQIALNVPAPGVPNPPHLQHRPASKTRG